MINRCLILLFLTVWIAAPVQAAPRAPAAAIASAHPLATAAGHEILAAGGNAFDATVAVSAVLSVVEPYSSGMGGGGFWLLHRAEDDLDIMVDGRERAPLAARRDMYLDEQGQVVPGLSMDGALAAGIPGQTAALVHIAERYGRLPLAQTLAPAIRHARHGFPVTPHYRRMAGLRKKALQQSPAAAKTFLHQGEVPPLGQLIRQPALAATLEAIALHGRAGFYRGAVAERLLAGVKQAGGIWSQQDLDDYRVIERPVLRGHYRGYEVVSAAPPSSGGVALITMLNILEQYEPETLDAARRTHLLVESMRRAYRDRAQFLGDSDFVEVPLARLTHRYYAQGLVASIRLDRATASSELPGFAAKEGGKDTTHFSILDREGNYVAATLSINYPFGACFMPPETGVLLNNEMDDFSAKPGTPNAYGLVGAEANAIAPGKRMLSSMSPTFVRNDERVAILGTPGGSRIISMVLLGILEFVDGKGPEAWVARPRIHHQYLPDTVFFEPAALSNEQQAALEALGHTLKQASRPWGNMQAVLWNIRSGQVSAASDPRVEGMAAVR